MAESQKGRIAALAAVSEHLQLLPWAARAQGLSISKAGDSAAFLLRSLTTFMAKKKTAFTYDKWNFLYLSLCPHA